MLISIILSCRSGQIEFMWKNPSLFWSIKTQVAIEVAFYQKPATNMSICNESWRLKLRPILGKGSWGPTWNLRVFLMAGVPTCRTGLKQTGQDLWRKSIAPLRQWSSNQTLRWRLYSFNICKYVYIYIYMHRNLLIFIFIFKSVVTWHWLWLLQGSVG